MPCGLALLIGERMIVREDIWLLFLHSPDALLPRLYIDAKCTIDILESLVARTAPSLVINGRKNRV